MCARTRETAPLTLLLCGVAAFPVSLLWVTLATVWVYEWIPGTGEPPEPTWTSIGSYLVLGAPLALVGAGVLGLWAVILQPRLEGWSRKRRLLLAATLVALASAAVLAYLDFQDWEYRAGFKEVPFVLAGALVASVIQLVRLAASLMHTTRPDGSA